MKSGRTPLPRTTTRKLKRFEMEKRVRANQDNGTGFAIPRSRLRNLR